MKILYILPWVPYPLNNGGNQAFYMMTDAARELHQVSLLLYIHNADERERAEHLMKLWQNVTFFLFDTREEARIKGEMQSSPYASMPWLNRKVCEFLDYWHHSTKRKLDRRKWHHALQQLSHAKSKACAATALASFVRANSNLFHQKNNDLTSAFCEYVREVAAMGFDIVQVEFYEYLPLIYMLPTNCKRVFVHHELRFVRNENELSLLQNPLPTDILILEEEKAKELVALKQYDTVITLTDIDRKLLIQYLPENKIYVSPAITNNVNQEKKRFQVAQELVFVGSGSHFPNADGMIWFCSQVLPILRQRQGSIPRIHITGHWRRELKAYVKRQCPEAVFDGFVDDLPTFINGKISIVPIRIGSGMRMKILDSVSAAAPLVTTSKGCEGLPIEHRQHCLIADTPETYADALIEILADKKLQQSLATKAQDVNNTMLKDAELIQQRLAIYKKI